MVVEAKDRPPTVADLKVATGGNTMLGKWSLLREVFDALLVKEDDRISRSLNRVQGDASVVFGQNRY